MRISLGNGGFALIDKDDFPLVKGFKWKKRKSPVNPNNLWYAAAQPYFNGIKRTILMHRVILGVTDSRVKVDHRNFNGLDNRRRNIRVATDSQSAMNRRPFAKSGFKGVYWTGYMFQAQLGNANGKRVSLGTFKDPVKAARAYDAAAKEKYGEFACLNFPEPELDKSCEYLELQSMTKKLAGKPDDVCPRCGGTGKMMDWVSVGAPLRKRRLMKRVTMLAIAQHMGVSESYISDLERGRRAFNHTLQVRYKEALDKVASNGSPLAPGEGAPSAGFPAEGKP